MVVGVEMEEDGFEVGLGGKLEEQEKHLLSVCVVSTKGMDKETPYILISGTG